MKFSGFQEAAYQPFSSGEPDEAGCVSGDPPATVEGMLPFGRLETVAVISHSGFSKEDCVIYCNLYEKGAL